MKKPEFIMFFSILLFMSSFAWGADSSSAGNLIGVWIVTWDHGAVSMKDAAGNVRQEARFSPGSYGMMGENQPEYLYAFRTDGTGTYMERWIRKPAAAAQPVVVIALEKSSWVEKDVLSKKVDFMWKTVNGQLVLDITTRPAPLFLKSGAYNLEWNDAPKRPVSWATTADGYGLSDELIIYNIGALRRIGAEDGKRLLDHYGIKG